MAKNEERLVDAVMYGRPDEVDPVLKKGANPNAKNSNGDTLLASAAWYGRKETALLLLKAGAKPNLEKGAALYNAVRSDRFYPEIIQGLVDHGAKLDYVYNIDNTCEGNILTAAIYWSHAKAAHLLLEIGADIHFKNEDGHSPFSFAASARMRELGKAILDRGYKPDPEVEAEIEFVKDIENTKELHDNFFENLYTLSFTDSGPSPHTTGNPDIGKIFNGTHFTNCSNLPVHLLTTDLSLIEGLPAEVSRMGRIHVVYQNCTDCDGPDIEPFRIEPDGRISIIEIETDEEPVEPTCEPESYRASEEITYLELNSRTGTSGPIILGGEPSWLQRPEWADCCECNKRQFYIGRIYQFEVPPGAEGGGDFIYFFVCPDCRTVSVVRQNT